MEKKILILGSNGFIGQNIKNFLINHEIFTKNYSIFSATKLELDVLKKEKLNSFFEKMKPDIVINATGIVGSSIQNSSSNEYEIFSNNIMMQTNILDCCDKFQVKKVIFFSTYRIFGENIHENYNESNLYSIHDFFDNSGYLLSKKMLHLQLNLFQKQNSFTKYVCLILPNIYGKLDTFKENARIVSAFIKKIAIAKEKDSKLIIYSNSNNQVNLIYVEDLFLIIEKCILEDSIRENILVFNKKGIFSIEELAQIIKEEMDFKNEIIFTDTHYKLNKNNIMKPNISKFDQLFPKFPFSNTRKTIQETIQHYFKTEMGMS